MVMNMSNLFQPYAANLLVENIESHTHTFVEREKDSSVNNVNLLTHFFLCFIRQESGLCLTRTLIENSLD